MQKLSKIIGQNIDYVLLVSAHVQLSTRLDSDEIHLGKKVGQGGIGSVYRATWRGLDVAVKVTKHRLFTNK